MKLDPMDHQIRNKIRNNPEQNPEFNPLDLSHGLYMNQNNPLDLSIGLKKLIHCSFFLISTTIFILPQLTYDDKHLMVLL